MHAWIFATRKRGWLALALVVLFLAGAAFMLERQQFVQDQRQAERAAQRDLNLLSVIVADALRRGMFQEIQPLLSQWGASNPELFELRVTAANGAVLGAYRRSNSAARTYAAKLPVSYSYHGEARVESTVDLAEVDARAAELRTQLLVTWLVLAALSAALVQLVMARQQEAAMLRRQAASLDEAYHALDEEGAQRQRIEQERGRLATILEATNDFVGLADTEGRTMYINHGGRDLVGLDISAALGMPMASFHPQWAADLILGEGIPAAARVGVWEGETALRGADGRDIPVSQVILSHRDESGKLRYFSTIMRDISERRRMDSALRRSQFSLDHAPDAVFWIDAEGRATYVNEQACRSLGYRRDELVGMHVWDFDPDYPRDGWEESWRTLRASGARTFQTRHRRKDGSIFPVEIASVHMTYGDSDLHVSFVRDITERQRVAEELRRLNADLEARVEERTAELRASNTKLQEAMGTLQRAQDELVRSEKLSSLGSLVAGVAHELNTPLGNSVTVATTLADRIKQFGKEVESGNVRRSSLNDFMEFSQKASAILMSSLFTASELIGNFKQVAVDQTSAQRRPFDLGEVVREVVMTLQPKFKATPHRIEVAVAEGIRLDSYPGPLGQVLTNLVGNALFHGFEGHPGGTVKIEAAAVDDWVKLTVADDGWGIARANLGRIFDPFFTTRLGQGGSGLGLHIVYSIVARVLGGRIDVASETGKGTTFTVEMPRRAPESSADALGNAISLGKA